MSSEESLHMINEITKDTPPDLTNNFLPTKRGFNVKKNAPRMFNFRILHSTVQRTQDTSPTPPPQKNNVEG